MNTARPRLKRDASNFDDYLMMAALAALFVALVLL
jgi:hypothetical protein